jgi:hypothetical protein
MKALIIRSPWINLILNGEKTWEIRGSATKIRDTIGLIESGTSTIVGTAVLTGCQQLSPALYLTSTEFHGIPHPEDEPLPYSTIYAWHLTHPQRFALPIPYHHPHGAVIWVNVSLEDLSIR